MRCIVIPTCNTSNRFVVVIDGIDADTLSRDINTCSKLLEDAYSSCTEEGEAINKLADIAIMILDEINRVSEENQEIV